MEQKESHSEETPKNRRTKAQINARVRQRCDNLLFAFGQKIREVRIKKGLTQSEFGVFMGFSEKSGPVPINHIENGRKDLSLLKLMEVADKAGFDIGLKISPRTQQEDVLVASGKSDLENTQ